MATGLENLKVYTMAKVLEDRIYEVTDNFPQEEKYRRVDQMRRASSSIVDNIAESYGKFHYGEKLHSISIARGEAEELRSQIKRVTGRYISEKVSDQLIQQTTELIKAQAILGWLNG